MLDIDSVKQQRQGKKREAILTFSSRLCDCISRGSKIGQTLFARNRGQIPPSASKEEIDLKMEEVFLDITRFSAHPLGNACLLDE